MELYELYKNGNVQLLQDQINSFNQVAIELQQPGIVNSMNAMQLSVDLSVAPNSSINDNELDQNINNTTQELNSDGESDDGWQVARSRKTKRR